MQLHQEIQIQNSAKTLNTRFLPHECRSQDHRAATASFALAWLRYDSGQFIPCPAEWDTTNLRISFVFMSYGRVPKKPVKSLCLVLGLNWLKFCIFHIFLFWFLALVYFWSSTSISFFSQFLKQRLFSVELEIWTETFVSLLLADKREGRLELALLLSIRTQHGNKKLSESERSLLFTPLFEYFNFIGFSITW